MIIMNEKYGGLMTGIIDKVNDFKEHNVITAYRRHKESKHRYQDLINDSDLQQLDFSNLESLYNNDAKDFETAINGFNTNERNTIRNYIHDKNELYSQAKKAKGVGKKVTVLGVVASLIAATGLKMINDAPSIYIDDPIFDNNTGKDTRHLSITDTNVRYWNMVTVDSKDQITSASFELLTPEGEVVIDINGNPITYNLSDFEKIGENNVLD